MNSLRLFWAAFLRPLAPVLRWIESRELTRLWFKESRSLLIEVVAFNLFALLIVYPVLQWLFPPLTGWEKFKSFFSGSHRLTYMEIAPITAKVLWIFANGLFLAMLHRRFSKCQKDLDSAPPSLPA